MRLFDWHCDTLNACVDKNYPLLQNSGHVDVRRLQAFEVAVQVFAAWIPDTLRGEAAWERGSRLLQRAQTEERLSAGQIHFMCKGESLDESNLPKHTPIGILAVENGAVLGGDLRRLDRLAAMGVKYITLTWNGDNELAGGCLGDPARGLTPFGRSALRRMNALGVAADVSHLNERGFWEVAAETTAPLLASHSNAAAVCPHPRNLSDAQFAAVRQSGGLVGLTFCAAFLGSHDFEQIERHLDHFWSLGGEKVVALGGDWDGTNLPPEWNGIAVVLRLYEYLCRKNYDTDLLKRLFFGNSYDFLKRL